MKDIISSLIIMCTLITFSQSNQELLSHYNKYYKQMQSHQDIQGIINALTHLSILAPNFTRVQQYVDYLNK